MIKRTFSPAAALSVCLAAFLLTASAAEEASEAYVALVQTGGGQAVNLEKLRTYLVNELQLKIVVLDSLDRESVGTLDYLKTIKGESALALLAFTTGGEEGGAFLTLDPDSGVAVIHLDTVRPDEGQGTRYERRLEKLAMRAVGGILGIPASPNSRCVMAECSSLETLDSIGRNFSPPTQILYRRALNERGISLKDFY
ncbi:MAG: hypothetical protein KJ626_12285 [Verrucomicrobia bacterium]|nr:hypothetical protein [Verrucomicrobiota bacterium]